jgi:arylsulfatase A-like enzyme
VLAAAGVAAPDGLDGVDLGPWLAGERRDRPHDALYWRIGASWAVRDGDLKLVSDRGAEPALYDLAADAGEASDLAPARPDDVARLRARWDAWAAELAPPLWSDR